jgi:hypothetical protein
MILGVVAVVGLVFFFSMSGKTEGHGTESDNRTTERFTIGDPWPWYERHAEKVVIDGNTRVAETTAFRWASPAWLLLVGAIGLGVLVYRLRPATRKGPV